jgi:putative RNA 2'-phosphotransferase
MNEYDKKRISKFLSLILRHKPELIALELDENGWASVDDILSNKKQKVDFQQLKEVVETNDKKRFSFNLEETKIRANQGHSLKDVDLDLAPQTPPNILYHGTVSKFMDPIKKSGLLKMNRQHVHLSKDKETATIVGKRRGKPILLEIDTMRMMEAG